MEEAEEGEFLSERTIRSPRARGTSYEGLRDTEGFGRGAIDGTLKRGDADGSCCPCFERSTIRNGQPLSG